MAEPAIKLVSTEPEGGTAIEPRLRWATEADRAALIELMRVALGEGAIPRTEAFWRWKHEQNPFGASPVMVAEAKGRIVALRTFLRWRWRLGERRFAAVRPVDTATHPDWRRRGLFERLTRALIEAMREEGVAFVFNTPNPKSGQGYQKLGWRIVGRPTIWIRPQKPLRLLQGLWRGRGRGGARASEGSGAPPPPVLDSPDLEDFLKHRPLTESRLTTDADGAYLRWRYRDCPGFAYGVEGEIDRRSGALLAWRAAEQRGFQELRIADLFVADDKASRRKARAIITERLRAEDADFASARANPGTPAAAVLKSSGFFPAPRLGPKLAVRPLAGPADLPPLERLSTFGASIGDLELF